jgi:hypothetical protein
VGVAVNEWHEKLSSSWTMIAHGNAIALTEQLLHSLYHALVIKDA